MCQLKLETIKILRIISVEKFPHVIVMLIFILDWNTGLIVIQLVIN